MKIFYLCIANKAVWYEKNEQLDSGKNNPDELNDFQMVLKKIKQQECTELTIIGEFEQKEIELILNAASKYNVPVVKLYGEKKISQVLSKTHVCSYSTPIQEYRIDKSSLKEVPPALQIEQKNVQKPSKAFWQDIGDKKDYNLIPNELSDMVDQYHKIDKYDFLDRIVKLVEIVDMSINKGVDKLKNEASNKADYLLDVFYYIHHFKGHYVQNLIFAHPNEEVGFRLNNGLVGIANTLRHSENQIDIPICDIFGRNIQEVSSIFDISEGMQKLKLDKCLFNDYLHSVKYYKQLPFYIWLEKQEKSLIQLNQNIDIGDSEPSYKKFIAYINAGKIYTDAAETAPAEGRFLYAISMDKKLHIGRVPEDIMHHPELTGGLPCLGAGELEMKNGKIELISNISGHFTPDLYCFNQTINILKSSNILADNCELVFRHSDAEKRLDFLDYKTSISFWDIGTVSKQTLQPSISYRADIIKLEKLYESANLHFATKENPVVLFKVDGRNYDENKATDKQLTKDKNLIFSDLNIVPINTENNTRLNLQEVEVFEGKIFSNGQEKTEDELIKLIKDKAVSTLKLCMIFNSKRVDDLISAALEGRVGKIILSHSTASNEVIKRLQDTADVIQNHPCEFEYLPRYRDTQVHKNKILG